MDNKHLIITEHVIGYYSYHLSSSDKKTVALCGKDSMMQTEIPLSAWGTKSHLNERWCCHCVAKYAELEQRIKKHGG